MVKPAVSDSQGDIRALVDRRSALRRQKKYREADRIRRQLESTGYTLIDTPTDSHISPPQGSRNTPQRRVVAPGKIVLFGSGEMSPTGRQIHEELIKPFQPPVNIAFLTTPAGFEVNPNVWYYKLKRMMEVGLDNYRPQISIVAACWRGTQEGGTDNADLLVPLRHADYIHTGAGSPTYAVKKLKDSLALSILSQRLSEGVALSFASAAAIAVGQFQLPVYEIYKVGDDPFWRQGLDFFSQFGLSLTIIPHWNNTEGGPNIDTSRCFIGRARFEKLRALLPSAAVVIGIDEHSAVIFDIESKSASVRGLGSATIYASGQEVKLEPGESISFERLAPKAFL